MNIKFKLTLWFTIIVATIVGISFYVVYENYSLFRQSNFYERLKDRAQYTAKAVLDSQKLREGELETINNFTHSVSPNFKMSFYDSTGTHWESIGQHIEMSRSLYQKILNKKYIEEQIDDTQYVYFSYKLNDQHIILLASSYDKAGYYKVVYLRRIFTLIWVLSIFTTAFAGWWFARISLRPMTQVINNVSNITDKNLHSRLPVTRPTDEIANLSITFNQMLDRLEEAFALQKDFVSNASHEFRTPLTAIKGQIQVALLKDRTPAEYQQLLTSLNEDINNIIALLNALQELAKANANVLPKEFIPVSILDIVLEVQNEFAKSKPQYEITISVLENESQNDESLYCLGESSLLKSVISNIIDNGCKFSPDFKIQLNISFTSESIILTFIDEGVGIASENISHVFEPFFRGNDTRNIYGHGIGLSLVKRIIELHRGQIDMSSIIGKGTTVTVTLPNTNNPIQ
jgi:two-component system sensor histidine kinase ArlS